MICFGPIPSRRLGKSLGINNIVSPKTCSYGCIYCQVGQTRRSLCKRESFFSPDKIYKEATEHLRRLAANDMPDYLTFVSNGEPTLDLELGESISRLRETGIPVAVITNGSMLKEEQVKEALLQADWVSVKMDAADAAVWKRINRPHPSIDFEEVLAGVFGFFREFQGIACTETMLVKGINDSEDHLYRIAGLVHTANPSMAYISIPTRPPAEKSVVPATEEVLNQAWQIISNTGVAVEFITGFEGTGAGYTGNIYEDILNITAVHPLREDTIKELVEHDNANMSIIDSLISQRLIKVTEYGGKKYYLRRYNA
jgi:wyosine [tRNA(Phe)-imidazoG37] synthetase (radical SAM superfamily)